MQIDFKALEQAFAPIEEIGQGEITFDAGPTTITLRVILPHEEVEGQKYAAGALNEVDEGEQSAVDYLDRLRIGFLSHSIIAIGDQDFRDVDFVETGEMLANKKPIKIPRYKAMRKLLGRWTRITLTAVFSKFNELVQRAEVEAEKQIEYEPSSIPSEIDRLQKKIDDLNVQVAQNEAADKASITEKVSAMADPGVLEPDPAPIPEDDEPEVNPEQMMPAAQRRTGPITPVSAPPPPERRAPPPQPASQPVPEQPPVQKNSSRANSSFINTEDDDGMDAALDAEHNRILEMRRRVAASQQADDGSALQAIHPQMGRRPPHQDAAIVEAEVQERGTLDGRPVFALPTQDLDTKAPAVHPRGHLNPAAGSNRNPRFKGPQKP